MIKARPFIKWAGGKGQLLAQLEEYLPTELRKGKIYRYVEPFGGGEAMFFSSCATLLFGRSLSV
ncbi:MAG: DNA adenine methylase [Bacteroidia bacterium]|nr:DNA adenine methylase [Bacteroidia bacterium]MDW8157958.1 DNA adenine methylase [Bacteroidia bacterium]